MATQFDRLRPISNSSSSGGTGAIVLLLRYDKLEVGDTPVAARAGNEALSYTAVVKCCLSPNFQLQFRWIISTRSKTPLDPTHPADLPGNPRARLGLPDHCVICSSVHLLSSTAGFSLSAVTRLEMILPKSKNEKWGTSKSHITLYRVTSRNE